MSEQKVSPLLDAMEIGECFASHGGVRCCWIRHPESGREFVLKHISVPPTQDQVQALLLTGAYSTAEQAEDYYRREAEDLVREVEERKKLLDCPFILPFLGVQMEKKEEGVGYDVYTVLPKRNSLQSCLNENSISHLRGINMGIDICVALAALREEGYIFGNLKPGNIFFSDSGRFLLGDFGLLPTEDMKYGVLPEQYRSSYTAPELRNFIGGLNTTVDIYALGMILYRIYNGNHAPFEDEKTPARAADVRRLDGDPLPAPLYADYELTEIIQKACAYEPADRYHTPDEMRIDLEQYMRRNAVSDHLIVPPLVTDGSKVSPEPPAPEEEEPEPGHFTAPEKPEAPEDKKRNRKKKKAGSDKANEKKPDKTDDKKPDQTEGKKPVKTDEKKPAGADEKKPDQADEKKPDKADEKKPDKADEKKPAGDKPTEQEGKPAEPEKAGQEKAAEPEKAGQKKPAVLPEEPGSLPAKKTPAPETGKHEKPAADKTGAAKQPRKRANQKKRRGKGWLIFAAVMLLAVALIGLWEFGGVGRGMYHFLAKVHVEVADVTADSMRLRVDTNISEGSLKAFCTDPYGTSFESPVRNGRAEFTGLTPGTQYQLNVEVSGLHKVTGVTTAGAATKPQAEILSFTAADGAEPGALQLNLTLRDEKTEPAAWTVAYAPTGVETEKRESFSGRSCLLTGLEGGREYRFRLLGSEDLYLSGQTELVYTPLREILADGLRLDSVLGGTARVSWHCSVEPPEAWTVTCRSAAAEDAPLLETGPVETRSEAEGFLCSAETAGIVSGETYLLQISAPGLYRPLSLMFNGTWAKAVDLRVESLFGDEALLRWTCESDLPEQWLLTCADGTDRLAEVELYPAEAGENGWSCSAAIRGLRPGADYSVELSAPGMEEPQTLSLKAPYIQVGNLLLDGLYESSATVSWDCDTENHEDWLLSCCDRTGRAVEVTVNPDVLNENSYYCSATIHGLRPGEVYTLDLHTEGMEAPLRMEITTPYLAVADLALEGISGPEAILRWNCDRADHSAWLLSCLSDGGVALQTELLEELPVDNGVRCGAKVRGLQAGMHCTAELYAEGMEEPVRLEFDMPTLQVSELQLDGLYGGDAHVSWSCDSEAHAPWQISCKTEDGTELAVDVNPDKLNENSFYCSATVHDLPPETACVLTLFADGMTEPLTLTLHREAVIVISDLQAVLGEDGAVLTWTSSSIPAAGWRIRKACGDAETELTVPENNCTVAVLPETEYVFTVEPADGSDYTGENTVTLRTRYASRFSGLGVQGDGTTIGTYYTPNKENWTDADLGSGTVTYRHDDRITFQITVAGSPEDTDRQVTTQCVVRDANERIVHVTEELVPWNSLWKGRKWTAPVPWLPETAGSYTFSVYINGRRFGTIGFRLVD